MKTTDFLSAGDTFSRLTVVIIMLLSESIGFYFSDQTFSNNSSATSQEASPFPPLELEPCSPQTAPLSPPRRVFPLTDLEVYWPPSPVSFPLLPTVLPPPEEGDPPLALWLQDRSDEAEVVQRLGSAGRAGPWQWTGVGRMSLL